MDRLLAIQYMNQSLKIAIETEPLNPMRFELPGMALLLADQGQAERAIEFYAAAFLPAATIALWIIPVYNTKVVLFNSPKTRRDYAVET